MEKRKIKVKKPKDTYLEQLKDSYPYRTFAIYGKQNSGKSHTAEMIIKKFCSKKHTQLFISTLNHYEMEKFSDYHV